MPQAPASAVQPIGITKTVSYDFDTAVQKATAALQQEGFGVLCDIDVKATVKKKLDIDRPEYRILGACNPSLANKALDANADLGLLLPCNVTVYRDGGAIKVSAVRPTRLLSLLPPSPVLDEVARDVEARMQRVMDAL